MAKYRVVYDRKGCISAAVCVAVNPKRWALDASDGRANLLNGKKTRSLVSLKPR